MHSDVHTTDKVNRNMISPNYTLVASVVNIQKLDIKKYNDFEPSEPNLSIDVYNVYISEVYRKNI